MPSQDAQKAVSDEQAMQEQGEKLHSERRNPQVRRFRLAPTPPTADPQTLDGSNRTSTSSITERATDTKDNHSQFLDADVLKEIYGEVAQPVLKCEDKDSTNPPPRCYFDSLFDKMEASQKKKSPLAIKIEETTKYLSKGIMVQLYCCRKRNLEMVVLTFSEDWQLMSIYGIEKKQMEVFCMKDFQLVSKGFKSGLPFFFLKDGSQISQEKCFNLTFQGRSHIFYTGNAQLCGEIFDKIGFMSDLM